MGLLALVEDRPTPPAVYNWRVYACASVASFASCMIGYDSAFIGTTLKLDSFSREFRLGELDDDQLALVESNIVSIYQAGAFFGSIFAYASNYFLGRRRSLLLFSALLVLGAGLMLGADGQRGLGLLYAGRVLAGVSVGGCSMIVPIYISELSPPAVRGRLVGIYEMGWQIGGLVGFWINYGVNETLPADKEQWLIPFAVQLIPGGLLLLGTFWIPESPRWLLQAGQRELGLRNLCWVRNLGPEDIYIVEELSFIDEDVERYRREVGAGFWKPFVALKDPKVQWRFLLGSLLFLFQNGAGINAINYYSPTIFSSIGLRGNDSSFLTTGIFGVVKCAVTIVWILYLIDKMGRRNLLMIGAFGGSVCMWYIAAYIYIADPERNPTDQLTGGGISAIFFFYLWTAFYTPTWNGTPWVINAEMFDQNTRSLGQTSAACSNWLWNFLISRFTPQMFLAMGYGVYMFFAALMLVSIVFVFFCIPESKAIPLEAMDRLFAVKPVRRAHATVMGELDVQDAEFRRNVEGAGVGGEKVDVLQKEVA